MSFIKVNGNNFEYSGVELHPEVHYISSSIGLGITGSVKVSATENRKSHNLTEYTDEALDFFISNPHEHVIVTYDDSRIKNKEIPIFRFDPPFVFNGNSTIKNHIRNVLMPHHAHRYQNCEYSYSNYNSLNFTSSGSLSDKTAIIYNNNNGEYNLGNPFCLSFWINPRDSVNIGNPYTPGTIFHLSSSIAVSLVSAHNGLLDSTTKKNENDEVDRFKILVQLKHSADTAPSDIDLSPAAVNNSTRIYPNDLVFTSSHSLKKDHWHNVTIQWGQSINNGSGSIFIDNNETNFVVNSGSLGGFALSSPKALVIGNWFGHGTGDDLLKFIRSDDASSQGYDSSGDSTLPIGDFDLAHPLNAEIHELKLFNKYFTDTIRSGQNDTEFNNLRYKGITKQDFNSDNCQFLLGPYFHPDINTRDILVSPYRYKSHAVLTNTSTTPFNVDFSFRVGGKLLNLENFVVDFKNNKHPRLFNLFPIKLGVANANENKSADNFIYENQTHKRINLSILPCDNGLFRPNYDLYTYINTFNDYNRFSTGGSSTKDYSIISLENNDPRHIGRFNPNTGFSYESFYDVVTGKNIVNLPEALSNDFSNSDEETIFQALCGPNPQHTGNAINQHANSIPDSDVMFIPYMTKDASSNEISVFDISNLYYGKSILPGSFEIFEKHLTGSDENISIRLKDNGMGSLYRADAKTKHATWNNVGNIFYEEGLVIIKSPHLVYFCKDRAEIKFKGTQNIHTMILNVPAYKNLFNSSSNPTFESVPPSDNTNDEDLSTMYISTVNIHDKNFNIIMKANFSQPILKTVEDEFIIRLKEDF